MPTVTYTGSWYSRPSKDVRMPEWVRGRKVEVTQTWLDDWKYSLGDDYRIEGDDAGNDGLPDENWNRPELVEWLSDNGVELGIGYKTKSTLLSLVEGVLNPAPVEVPVVEVPVEEAVDDTTEEE